MAMQLASVQERLETLDALSKALLSEQKRARRRSDDGRVYKSAADHSGTAAAHMNPAKDKRTRDVDTTKDVPWPVIELVQRKHTVQRHTACTDPLHMMQQQQHEKARTGRARLPPLLADAKETRSLKRQGRTAAVHTLSHLPSQAGHTSLPAEGAARQGQHMARSSEQKMSSAANAEAHKQLQTRQCEPPRWQQPTKVPGAALAGVTRAHQGNSSQLKQQESAEPRTHVAPCAAAAGAEFAKLVQRASKRKRSPEPPVGHQPSHTASARSKDRSKDRSKARQPRPVPRQDYTECGSKRKRLSPLELPPMPFPQFPRFDPNNFSIPSQNWLAPFIACAPDAHAKQVLIRSQNIALGLPAAQRQSEHKRSSAGKAGSPDRGRKDATAHKRRRPEAAALPPGAHKIQAHARGVETDGASAGIEASSACAQARKEAAQQRQKHISAVSQSCKPVASSKDEVECAVCLEVLVQRGVKCACIPCGHTFHSACMKQVQQASGKCPQCSSKFRAADVRQLFM